MRSPQRPRRGTHARRGPGRHRVPGVLPGVAGWAGRQLGTPSRLAAVAALAAAGVGMGLTGPAALATDDVDPTNPPAWSVPPAGDGLPLPGFGLGIGDGAPDGSHPAGPGGVPGRPEPSDPEPGSSPEPAPDPGPGGAEPSGAGSGQPTGPADVVAGGGGLGARWQDAGVAPAGPDTVERGIDGIVDTDRLAVAAATSDAAPAADGRIGLLALVAAICAAGVSVGTLRVMIAQRAVSGRTA